jgi:hypothetical protein
MLLPWNGNREAIQEGQWYLLSTFCAIKGNGDKDYFLLERVEMLPLIFLKSLPLSDYLCV